MNERRYLGGHYDWEDMMLDEGYRAFTGRFCCIFAEDTPKQGV